MERFHINPARHDSVQAWAEEFYTRAAESGRLYRGAADTLTFIRDGAGPRQITSYNEFVAAASSLVDLGLPSGGRTNTWIPSVFHVNDGQTLYHSDACARLPKIEAVVREPVIARVSRVNWDDDYVLVNTPGYDVRTRIYYDVSDGAASITPLSGTHHLERCFSGVPFQDPAYRNNIYAWLLGAIVIDPKLDGVPMLTVTGNDRGVGKSSLVRTCGYILTGAHQSPIQYRGSEMEKNIGARFLEHNRFISLDNVTTSGGQAFSNSRLASLLTDGWSKKVRILGQSRSVAQSGVLFALTMNDCTLDADLSTRALAVSLYKDMPGPMKPYCVSYAMEHRAQIYGELLTLAMQSVPEKEVQSDANFRFRAWLNFVQPRIVPHFGSLALRQAEDFDDRILDLFGFGVDHVDEPFSSTDLFERMRAEPDRFPGLAAFVLGAKSQRARLIKLGCFLSNNVGRNHLIPPDSIYTLEVHKDRTEKSGAQYVFKQI